MTPRECLNRTDGSVPDRCLALRTTFFECKRSLVSFCTCILIGILKEKNRISFQLDTRQRFRGRKGY